AKPVPNIEYCLRSCACREIVASGSGLGAARIRSSEVTNRNAHARIDTQRSIQTPDRQSSARTRLLRPARCGDRSHGLPWFRKKLPACWPRARTTSQSFGACPWRCLYVLDSASYRSDIAGRLGKTALASPAGLPGSVHCKRDGGSGNAGGKVVSRRAPISSD